MVYKLKKTNKRRYFKNLQKRKSYKNYKKNKSVIIFDDVMTSGATLDEIARILKDNGVSRVINWVLLRTSKTSFR